MSKMGSAVLEGQMFAQDLYNESFEVFERKAAERYGKGTVEYSAAIEEHKAVNDELTRYYDQEPFIPYDEGDF